MDLSVSPDIEAYLSYLVVLLFGGFAAKQQISRRLGGYPGIWWNWRTWQIFAIYVTVPLVLFWLLDRTAAINDTSFFAAIIVAFGYERILSGGDSSIQASEGISKLWNPILTFIESLVTRITQQQMLAEKRLARRIIGQVVDDEDRFDALKQLACAYTTDVTALEENIKDLDAASMSVGTESVRAQKAEIFYNEMLTVDDYLFDLKEKKVISRRFYVWYGTPWKGRILTLLIVLSLMTTISSSVSQYVNKPTIWNSYYTWRITKLKTSDVDLYRARNKLSLQFQNLATADMAFKEIIHVLREPSLPMGRVDLILAMLLENRCHAGKANVNLPFLLLDSFNASNVDIRVRLNQVLMFFAEKDKANLGVESQEWNPTNGDSAIDLQRHIAAWREYWSQQSNQKIVSLLCQETGAPNAGLEPAH